MGAEHGVKTGTSSQWDRKRYKRQLFWSFLIVGIYFLVELVTGILTNSLALISDAGHMFTDVLGLGMALAAIHATEKKKNDKQKTYGLYRLEILAALANALLLFGVAVFILFEAVRRFVKPPEIPGVPMLIVAVIGLLVNVFVFYLLKGGAGENLNVEGAYLEVLADMLGSIGVVIAGVVILTTGFHLIDPIFGILIGFFVLPRTWRLGRKAIRILIQEAPPHIDLDEIRTSLQNLNGVCCVHDLHVWTLTSGIDVSSVHLCLQPDAKESSVLRSALTLLKEKFGIVHPTVQIEPHEFRECPQDYSSEHEEHIDKTCDDSDDRG